MTSSIVAGVSGHGRGSGFTAAAAAVSVLPAITAVAECPTWMTNPADAAIGKALEEMKMLEGKTDEEKRATVEVVKTTPHLLELIDPGAASLTLQGSSSSSSITLNASKNVCLSFLAGACKFGLACRQHHPTNPDEIVKWKTFFAKHPCKWGMNCRMRDRCLYTHPDQAMLALAQQQATLQALEKQHFTVQHTEVGPVKFLKEEPSTQHQQ